APQHGAEAPQARVTAATGVALVVVDSDQRSARRAYHRPGFLPKHPVKSIADNLEIWKFGTVEIQVPMRVLVTGGTGYLGSAIVRALARAGHSAVAFARHDADIVGDIRDTRAVTAAAAGVDVIIH